MTTIRGLQAKWNNKMNNEFWRFVKDKRRGEDE